MLQTVGFPRLNQNFHNPKKEKPSLYFEIKIK